MDIFIRSLKKLNFLRFLNLNLGASFENVKFQIPLLGGNGQQNFIAHEEWMSSVLHKLNSIKKGAFIDVGVNVGQTLLKIKSIDPDILYYGFEPNPTCVYYVNQLVQLNKLKNVSIFPVAIAESARIAELNFYYDSDTDSAASMVKDFRPQAKVRKTVFIPCFSVNDIQEVFNPGVVGIIKVDVEGAELDVLKGLTSLLDSSRPFVVMEILPSYTSDNKERLGRQMEIEVILGQYNYSILRIIKENDRLARFETIGEFGIHSNQDWCDYVFCPAEIVHSLIEPIA